MTEQKTSRTPWVYDDEPLEEPNGAPAEEHADKKTTYKTSPNMLKAIRKYEEEVKKDPNQLERRNHQKNYSGAKSFITYGAKTDELHFMKALIENVLKWSEGIEDFDQLRRPERKQLYQKR
ncbi:hypothetical protein [Streptococcus suis]|uniref:hypothetical protein n=1 Tax=Streptococcus suis TaxID=1307 RepID=UPI0010AA26B9|nr:hypothetical protein [Streptococcus suis]MBM7317921.1 hypothetical protein [Streptococcus suis]MBY4963556.1 hypothetical protein [Streptococcus suis]TII10991.1 hypothetical protein FAJ40_01930 [Streptococcus suis]